MKTSWAKKKRSGTRAFGEFQFRFNSRIRLRNGALNVAPRPAADSLRETIHRGRALQGKRREEAHRRNNANKPITSILRNRRESGRTARWGNGGKEGFLRSFEGSEKTGGEEKEKEGRE